MEKLIYTLHGANFDAPGTLAKSLEKCGAQDIRVNLRDEDVAPAAPLTQQRGESLPGAVVQFWLPSSNALIRSDAERAIGDACERFDAWLVSESTIIPNRDHPPTKGKRTYGFSQMAFLTLPEGMEWQDWRTVWRDRHTQIAIDTQSNFEYIQNLVVEPLTENAPPFVAIVEECFPPEAMTDPHAFFDAVGDPAKFEANLGVMMDSCARFIQQGTIDVIPTSQYNFS